jgi:hypothetical protein
MLQMRKDRQKNKEEYVDWWVRSTNGKSIFIIAGYYHVNHKEIQKVKSWKR